MPKMLALPLEAEARPAREVQQVRHLTMSAGHVSAMFQWSQQNLWRARLSCKAGATNKSRSTAAGYPSRSDWHGQSEVAMPNGSYLRMASPIQMGHSVRQCTERLSHSGGTSARHCIIYFGIAAW